MSLIKSPMTMEQWQQYAGKLGQTLTAVLRDRDKLLLELQVARQDYEQLLVNYQALQYKTMDNGE